MSDDFKINENEIFMLKSQIDEVREFFENEIEICDEIADLKAFKR